jgi:pilus assembly protein CpaF
MSRIDAYDVIRREVLARVERRRLHPEGDLDEVRAEVQLAIDGYERRSRVGDEVPLTDPADMLDRVLRSITDFGALTDLIARRDVEEIFVEGPRVSYLDGSGRLRGLTAPTGEEENRQILDRLLAATDRQLNTKNPMVQARVLQGTARLTAAIPPVGDQLSATLRRYTVRNVTLDDLVRRASISHQAAGFLWALMQFRSRITISGEPGAGKTTLAAALLAAAPPSHCVRCCEEVREIAVPITHGSYYEVRPASLDGTGEISLRDLVKFVLPICVVASHLWHANRPTRLCIAGSRRIATARASRSSVNVNCSRRGPRTSVGALAANTWTGTCRPTPAAAGPVGKRCWPTCAQGSLMECSRSIRIV